MTDKRKPLHEGTIRRSVKDGIAKPTTTQRLKPKSPPPAPKPNKSKDQGG